jgi:hypothetical protein
MRKAYIVAAIACVIIALEATSSFVWLLKNHEPIKEIKVYPTPRPDPLIYHLVNARCGEPRIGRLKEFLECRDRLYLEIF